MRDPGEFAVRGGLVDLFPAGEEQALRLDFFGDEIESVRRFEPASQRSIDTVDGFTLPPGLGNPARRGQRQALPLVLSRAVRRQLRPGDPLYQAVSDGRRIAGIDHWLPLFEERMATLFEHLSDDDLIVRDPGDAGAEARFEAVAIITTTVPAPNPATPAATAPLAPETLYLARDEWEALAAERPFHLVTPFQQPAGAAVVDFGVAPPRDFGPERAQGANLYTAVADHVASLKGRKVVPRQLFGGLARAPQRPARRARPGQGDRGRELG